MGLGELVPRVAGELARLDTYEVRKGGGRVDLSAVARAVLTSPRPTGAAGARCGE